MTFKARCAHILVPLTVVLLIVGLIRLTLGFAPVVFVVAAVTWSTISDGLVQGITTAAVATVAVDGLFVAPFLSVRLDTQFVWLGFNYILAACLAKAIRRLILRNLGVYALKPSKTGRKRLNGE